MSELDLSDLRLPAFAPLLEELKVFADHDLRPDAVLVAFDVESLDRYVGPAPLAAALETADACNARAARSFLETPPPAGHRWALLVKGAAAHPEALTLAVPSVPVPGKGKPS